MKSIIEQQLKLAKIENSSDEFKKEYKNKALETIISEIANDKNRYIFYCPDIVLVNTLVKLIYETAYEFHKSGSEVVILHEMNGFKCNWLFKDENYKHLKELKLDYIIQKKGAKTKRTTNNYSFKVSDTLIVPDQFIEMFENLTEVKLMQKVLLITSHVGISSIQPGTSLKGLGIDKIIFTEEKLREDYELLFNDIEYLSLINYPINSKAFSNRIEKEITPFITVSQIGNNDFVQQVINIFYNKYPNLKFFNFRLLDRNSLELYIENLQKAAGFLVLDKNLNSLQMIHEALSMGCPVFTTKRREVEDSLSANITLGVDAFDIADNLAKYCQYWLTEKTSSVDEETKSLVDNSFRTYENFNKEIIEIMSNLKQNRVEFFAKIKENESKKNL